MLSKNNIKTITILLFGLYFSQTLTKEHTKNIIKKQKADLIIISENNPKHLRQMVKSIFDFVPEIEKIYVLKDPCYGKFRDLYESIRAEHNQVEFIKVGPTNFKSMLESIISLSHNKHILLSTSNIIFTKHVDLNTCIELMDKTNSSKFYLKLPEPTDDNLELQEKEEEIKDDNQKITGNTCLAEGLDVIEREIQEDSPMLEENIFMWQFKKNFGQNSFANLLSMTLYKKSELLNIISPLNYTCPQELLDSCNNNNSSAEIDGLSFKTSKVLEKLY